MGISHTSRPSTARAKVIGVDEADTSSRDAQDRSATPNSDIGCQPGAERCKVTKAPAEQEPAPEPLADSDQIAADQDDSDQDDADQDDGAWVPL
jgi:hypothetical protein